MLRRNFQQKAVKAFRIEDKDDEWLTLEQDRTDAIESFDTVVEPTAVESVVRYETTQLKNKHCEEPNLTMEDAIIQGFNRLRDEVVKRYTCVEKGLRTI